jgi:cell division septation protein DedD
VDAPRTHYQISLTARQAVGLFASLLVALSAAFFFGLMAGLSGRAPAPDVAEPVAAVSEPPRTSEPLPRIETAVPTAVFSGASRTLLAPGGGSSPTPAAEPTVPATLQAFEDRSSDEAAAAETPPPPGARSGEPAVRATAGGSYWVQVASLTSRGEAGSLQARLSRRGFHAQILSAEGPGRKGRVYRVRVGPYASEPEAQRAASRLETQEKLERPWVVPEGK